MPGHSVLASKKTSLALFLVFFFREASLSHANSRKGRFRRKHREKPRDKPWPPVLSFSPLPPSNFVKQTHEKQKPVSFLVFLPLTLQESAASEPCWQILPDMSRNDPGFRHGGKTSSANRAIHEPDGKQIAVLNSRLQTGNPLTLSASSAAVIQSAP